MRAEAPAGIVVVRFSPMSVEGLERKAEVAYRDSGRYGWSVFCQALGEDQSIEELLAALCRDAPAGGRKVWITTIERLAKAGYVLEHRPPPPCHYVVDLGTELHPDAAERFVLAFDPPRRNPAWSGQ